MSRQKDLNENKINFFARTIRGLEWISAAEISGRLKTSITNIEHREVHFGTPNLKPNVNSLGSVDDVFINCGMLNNIDHKRNALKRLALKIEKINLAHSLKQLENINKIANPKYFEVIASFLGRRNYNRFEIEGTIGKCIERNLKLKYHPHFLKSEINIDISFRVHLRNQQALIGLRTAPKPLHRRDYKIKSRTGTLHPPIAFAMSMLCGVSPNKIFLDPFCGVGTIPIEATRFQSNGIFFGSDIDKKVIYEASINTHQAQSPIKYIIADAGKLPFRNKSIDRLISNVPWGRTVISQGELTDSIEKFGIELKRILNSKGRAVILFYDSDDQFSLQFKKFGLCELFKQKINVFGRWATISLLTPKENENSSIIDEDNIWGNALKEQLYFHKHD